MAPVGVQSIFHEDKETGLSEVCSEIGVPYILSTASSSSIEEVAKANGKGPRWFQLYWPQDDDVTISLLKRANSNGYTVLVVTLDTWALAWRPADLDGGYVPFMKGVGNKAGFTDTVFREKFHKKFNATPEEKVFEASREWVGDVFSGASHTWDHIALLKKHWDGPIVLKGIQHPEDAKLAVEHGVDGIIVSNHGGRQLDGAVGSLEMLPEIVEAVGDKLTILFDSGKMLPITLSHFTWNNFLSREQYPISRRTYSISGRQCLISCGTFYYLGTIMCNFLWNTLH